MGGSVVSGGGWRLLRTAAVIGVAAWVLDMAGWMPLPWVLLVCAVPGALHVCVAGGSGFGREGFAAEMVTAWLGLVVMAGAGPLLAISLIKFFL